jgi:glycosyltransferase involved in cell wall biosynthesis
MAPVKQCGPDATTLDAFMAWSPFVTIAIPTFNRADLLADCVRAALAQTYPHFEVLVSDNASSDRTPELLAQIDDRRLRVIRQSSNIGLLPNWNACLAGARGNYIVFVSDDDEILPHLLELCVRAMNGRADLPIVVTLSNLQLAALDETRLPRKSHVLKTGIHNGLAILTEFLTDRITVTNCSVMTRTDLLRKNGGFSLQLPHTADVASWAPLLLRGPAGFVNEACATFRLHNMSATSRLSIETLLEDGIRAHEVIADAIDRFVKSSRLRRTLRRQSYRCFTRRNLLILSDYRRSGEPLSRVVWLLWKCRSYLWPVDVAAATRFAAVILCPMPIADRLRRMRRSAAPTAA